MGHLHYHVKNVEEHVRFWTVLAGRADAVVVFRPPREGAVLVHGTLVFLTAAESNGGSDGSTVNHVAFRVPTFAELEARGLKVQRLDNFPGVGFTNTPEGERIELFEDAALNLTFTQDSGSPDLVSARHNQPVGVPISFHHVHLYVPEGQVGEAKAWYTRTFGGVPGKRSNYEAVDLPGINVNISVAPRPTVPTKGRMLDHIGFEVVGLEAFCARLRATGVTFSVPYARSVDGLATATLLDPWGTTIELTEGFRGLK
jgi:catechol 2,3-dioxygenase-like lactoylglutathione lyase family enzyme